MTNVTKYRFFKDYMADCFCDMEIDAAGDYVSDTDYDALAARLAEAERLLRERHHNGFDDAAEAWLRATHSAAAQETDSHE